MADQHCIDACEGAYKSGVAKCNQVLMDCLATSPTDEEKQRCKERFKKCMELCKEARQTCLEVC